MKKISMICLAAGMACAATAVAKPPLQLADKGIYVAPARVAPAKIVNGKFEIGDWQDYAPVSTRGTQAVYYTWDGFEAWVLSSGEYPNLANGGQGAAQFDTRFPTEGGACGLGSARWYFGSSYVNPLTAEDVTANGCFDQGGNAVDTLDFAWYWGGGSCVALFFTSNSPADCASGADLGNYATGVAVGFSGSIPPGGYYFTNVDGLNSVFSIFVPQPAPGGSLLFALTSDGSTLASGAGTQPMLWGMGNSTQGELFRPGSSTDTSFDDDAPLSATFSSNECYSYAYTVCPDPLQKTVSMGTFRCPADVNNDGFVNGDDYDAFASAFDVADLCADFNGDGFVNGDDYDAFASNFDAGC